MELFLSRLGKDLFSFGKPQSLNLTEEKWEAMKSSVGIKFDKRLMSDLTEKSSRIFKGLCNHRNLSQKKS